MNWNLVEASSPSGQQYPIDVDGCWDAPISCTQSTSEWKKSRFFSYYTNVFSHRVYISYCNEATEMFGNSDCAADGILPGGRNVHVTSKGNGATVRYAYSVVGAVKGMSDWVCESSRFPP